LALPPSDLQPGSLLSARDAYSIALTCPKASMWSIDGSGRADTLLLKRIGVEYRDTTVLRLKHWPQWSHSKELSTTPSPHKIIKVLLLIEY